MSGMRLRNSVRAPARYGEFDEEPRRSSLRNTNDDSFDDSMELDESGRPRSLNKRPMPITVPFNPNLPPAAFPTLDNPGPNRGSTSSALRPSRQNRAVNESQNDSRAGPRSPGTDEGILVDAVAPTVMNEALLSQIEDHVASNNMDNPVYARNMNMAQTTRANIEGTEGMETSDSDSDESTFAPDVTQALLDKIPNPEWEDLHRAMQVEIIENAMKHYDWRQICNMLGLGPDERTEFMQNLDTRNRQIERENKKLEIMRRKQRSALMRIDNSDLRLFDPPPQLVLKRITRENMRGMIATKYTDLLLCQTHEFLKARQFLKQHGLPREYAGDWGDSLVVLRDSVADSSEHDKFEWREHVRFSPPPEEIENPMVPTHDPITNARSTFIRSAGLAGTVNPRDLVRPSGDPEPILDWKKHFPRDRNSWVTQWPRRGGMVKLKIGPEKAAQIQDREDTLEAYGYVPPRWDVYKTQAMQGFPPSSPAESPSPVETPSKPSRNTRPGQPLLIPPAGPISRVLPHHSESQAKYVQNIQKVQVERLEAVAQAMRGQDTLQPPRRADKGVGVGMRAVSAIIPPHLGAHSIENLNPSPGFFGQANRGLRMGNIDDDLKQFIYSSPVTEHEEEAAEQPNE
ncbi:uncharacterized protein N7515_004712 [Penicillium bovifimosum]|uniref:Uncharacterized protein n=1 Tax=Penicillium bovifimosum TaxID=126998 RepID=A0A9W9L488_9EURO|nr:uncharacterized protein N7515_004712 [Penicillium bovifimosum]KAJ5135434.1 hypothetical protein N7515_004712 [Penicillium bovifimosum]